MNFVRSLLAKSWRNVHFYVVLVLAVILITGFVNLNVYTSQVILKGAYSPFFLVKNNIIELYQGAEEKSRLREALVDASVKLSMLEEATRENTRLRSALGFEPPTGYRIIPARVVSVYGYELPTSTVINKGTNDSIDVNQPVINQDGLIGRVVSVSADFASVQLLTDPLNRVAARVARSREMGIVKYHSRNGLVLDNFPVQGTIEIGDTIISSGLGGVYPAGLFVGIVTDIERPEKEPFSKINLKSAAVFRSIDELFILRTDSL